MALFSVSVSTLTLNMCLFHVIFCIWLCLRRQIRCITDASVSLNQSEKKKTLWWKKSASRRGRICRISVRGERKNKQERRRSKATSSSLCFSSWSHQPSRSGPVRSRPVQSGPVWSRPVPFRPCLMFNQSCRPLTLTHPKVCTEFQFSERSILTD